MQFQINPGFNGVLCVTCDRKVKLNYLIVCGKLFICFKGKFCATFSLIEQWIWCCVRLSRKIWDFTPSRSFSCFQFVKRGLHGVRDGPLEFLRVYFNCRCNLFLTDFHILMEALWRICKLIPQISKNMMNWYDQRWTTSVDPGILKTTSLQINK